MRFALLLVASLPLAAQTYLIGTPGDGCAGGTAYTIPATGATMRYGDFSCTFPVSAVGVSQVTLTFQEPCIAACSPPITAARQRVQNVYLNDSQIWTALDPYAAGSTTITSPVQRAVLVAPSGKQIIVRMQTVTRAAVLSSITITPGLTTAGGPSRLGLNAGPAPTDTVINGIAYDAVVYVDAVDGKTKVRKRDGSIIIIG